MPRVGEDIPLTLQLEDRNTGKYVRASVYNPSGAHIAGSPINLSHFGQGMYTAELPMPFVEFVRVAYEVYDDSGYSTPSKAYEHIAEPVETDEGTGAAGGKHYIIQLQVFGLMGVKN